jgi:hypothetical protein
VIKTYCDKCGGEIHHGSLTLTFDRGKKVELCWSCTKELAKFLGIKL